VRRGEEDEVGSDLLLRRFLLFEELLEVVNLIHLHPRIRIEANAEHNGEQLEDEEDDGDANDGSSAERVHHEAKEREVRQDRASHRDELKVASEVIGKGLDPPDDSDIAEEKKDGHNELSNDGSRAQEAERRANREPLGPRKP